LTVLDVLGNHVISHEKVYKSPTPKTGRMVALLNNATRVQI